MNVVTRLAIEGKSKKGWDGASIKVYLKISLPLDSIIPGATIALFPEENLKILDSQVHPLDGNSVPYNFSSTTSPLLHKAARALNLAARSTTSYVPDPMSSSSTSIPPLDDKYTGHILVSGYQVSYVLPKQFPRREKDDRNRRGSAVMHFMGAIDIWVPFLSRPPHAPFLLAIPVPRCLSNQIKLRIFPPGPSTASSYASLSSADEDGGAWELATDPHVTRSQSARLSRSQSYNNFADDESSDASTSAGFAEGCGIQGSFPSTDRIRVRWASPLKAGQIPEAADGRRRVGIKEVKGDMTCVVLGKSKASKRDKYSDGVLMKLDYTGTCKSVWFPGVATLLGMDVGLEADECDVSWAPGVEPKWTINGSAGFTGFAVGSPVPSVSRQSSADYPPAIKVQPSSPDARAPATNGYVHTHSPSLLRAPLPAQNVGDFSFEGSPLSTPTETVSSLASLAPPASPERTRRKRSASVGARYPDTDTDIDPDADVRPPRVPITIHLNMNELLPPSKNVFTFNVSGTVLVRPRRAPMTPDSRRSSPTQSRSPSDDELEDDPIAVPKFRVFYTDRESVSATIRNEAEQSSVLVYNVAKNRREEKTLKTVLSKGNQVACGTEGARIALRPRSPTGLRRQESSEDNVEMSYSRTRMSHGMRSVSSVSRLRETSMMSTAKPQPRRDGPLMIPSVTATITPLLGKDVAFKNGYAVHVCLPAPSDADSEWLEFGLALPSAETFPSTSTTLSLRKSNAADGPPRVDIASASVEGVPVRFQTSAAVKPSASLSALGLPFEETSGKEWICWVSVHVGQIGGGKVEVIYLVKGKEQDAEEKTKQKGKQKEQDPASLEILLPSFALPVGRLQVDIQMREDFEISTLRTNLMHQQPTSQGRMLLNYAMEEFFYPRLSMCVTPAASSSNRRLSKYDTTRRIVQYAIYIILVAALFSALVDLRRTTAELHAMRQSAANNSSNLDYNIAPETITVTTTVLVAESDRRWAITTTIPTNLDATSIVSEVPPSPPPDDALPTTTLVNSETSTTPSSPAKPTHPSESKALVTLHDFSLPWSLQFKIPSISIPDIQFAESARTTVDAVFNGVGAVWQLFRKVLHYPLDPP